MAFSWQHQTKPREAALMPHPSPLVSIDGQVYIMQNMSRSLVDDERAMMAYNACVHNIAQPFLTILSKSPFPLTATECGHCLM